MTILFVWRLEKFAGEEFEENQYDGAKFRSNWLSLMSFYEGRKFENMSEKSETHRNYY